MQATTEVLSQPDRQTPIRQPAGITDAETKTIISMNCHFAFELFLNGKC
jgi:hypothetical protein